MLGSPSHLGSNAGGRSSASLSWRPRGSGRASAITITFPDPATHASLYLIAGGIVVALGLARGVPVLRTLLSIAGHLVFAALLVLALDQRAAFEPYLARFGKLGQLTGQRVEGRETRLRMAPDGHFWVRATIDGAERRLLVDSGATVTALSSDTAAAAGLEVSDGPFPMLIRTANGTIRAGSAQVGELRLGNIVARDLTVVVSPGFGGMNVLGMNFLTRLKGWRVEGDTLILTPHAPQPVGG